MNVGGAAAADDAGQLRVEVERLRQQLAEEQQLRRQAEEAVEAVAADRGRLQKARDELAAALLTAERRAAEAEEEQLRAETAAAALEAALREQQQAAEAAAAAAPPSPARGSPGAAAAARSAAAGAAADGGLAADLEVLLAELDRERQRSEELLRALEAAEREAVSATERLLRAQQRVKQLESGGRRGLFGKRTPSAAALAEGEGEGETAAALQQRVAALKASRDKLIAACDAQAADVERLSGDNAALAESLAQLRDVAARWEAQAQDCLSQNERLKDLLEESATWGAPPAAAGGGAQAAPAGAGAAGDGAEPAGGGGAADGAALAALCKRLEQELLLEKARSAQLDVQVRALCMELTRAAQSSGQMQAALAPMLGGIEARLVQVLGMRPRPGVEQAARA